MGKAVRFSVHPRKAAAFGQADGRNAVGSVVLVVVNSAQSLRALLLTDYCIH